MKIALNILKALEIILTAVWGIIFGILAPLSIMYGDIVDSEISEHFIVRVWLFNSIACYFVGTVIVMLGLYKIALGFHTAGLVVSLYVYGVFGELYANTEAHNPIQLYMPVIFITLSTLAIVIIADYKKIIAKLSQPNDKKYEAAPSVLGIGEYKIQDLEKNTKNNKNIAKNDEVIIKSDKKIIKSGVSLKRSKK